VSCGRYIGSLLALSGAALVTLLVNTTVIRAAWDDISRVLGIEGPPAPASANVLSQHHLEELETMPPQAQAEFLLERSMNHYAGANAEIDKRLPVWRGRIEPNDQFETLFRMAINSDDLRVRAAAIEIDIVARKLEKDTATVDRLEPIARTGAQGARANALWDLGLLGGRGVEQGRIAEILQASLRDPSVNIRYWAVEGLGYLGTNDAIDPLLDVLHDDASSTIRERAACNLAQSGTLTRERRMSAVPRLLDFATDLSLDDQTRNWVFQALRDITGQNLPRDASAWRAWYERR
jgi:hypothetical protein